MGGPNPERCAELTCQLLGAFDPDEADHASVCVEEKPGSDRFLKYNQRFCEGDNRFADVLVASMPHASVGHAHVNQVLANICGGGGVHQT